MKKLTFSITGEFVTKTARDWYFNEHKPYETVEELLLSCMHGTEIPEGQLKKMAQDVLLGRAEFRGNSGDGSYCYVVLDEPAERNLFKEFGKEGQRRKEAEENLKAMTNKHLNLVDSLRSWSEGCAAEAIEYLENAEEKRLLIDIMRRYGEARTEYSRGVSTTVVCGEDGEELVVERKGSGSPMLDSYIEQQAIERDFEDNYGWIDPEGKFYPVEWGCHQDWARKEAVAKGWVDKEELDYGKCGDVLTEHGWILLHNPGKGIATVTMDKSKRITKKQSDFLFAYYQDRGKNDIAAEYLEY